MFGLPWLGIVISVRETLSVNSRNSFALLLVQVLQIVHIGLQLSHHVQRCLKTNEESRPFDGSRYGYLCKSEEAMKLRDSLYANVPQAVGELQPMVSQHGLDPHLQQYPKLKEINLTIC